MIINILFTILIVFAIFKLTKKQYIKNNNAFLNVLLISMMVMHFSMTIIQYKWSLISAFDSTVFFNRAYNSSSWFSLFKLGNRAMSFLCYPLTKLGLNYLSISLFFSFLSYLGYLIYFKELTKVKTKSYIHKTVLIVFFIFPSIHFWTGSLTKESILFLMLALLYYQLKKYKSISFTFLLSLMVMLFIRPYLALIILAVLVLIYYKTFNNWFKSVVVVISVFSIYLVGKFLKIKSFDSFQKNYSNLIKYADRAGNSSIDLGNSNYAERMLLVLFRPFFIDAKTVLQFFVSFENLIILLIVISLVFCYKHMTAILNFKVYKFMLVYIIILVLFFSIYMYNMGLANRMRVMFVPYIIILLLDLLKLKQREIKNNQ